MRTRRTSGKIRCPPGAVNERQACYETNERAARSGVRPELSTSDQACGLKTHERQDQVSARSCQRATGMLRNKRTSGKIKCPPGAVTERPGMRERADIDYPQKSIEPSEIHRGIDFRFPEVPLNSDFQFCTGSLKIPGTLAPFTNSSHGSFLVSSRR